MLDETPSRTRRHPGIDSPPSLATFLKKMYDDAGVLDPRATGGPTGGAIFPETFASRYNLYSLCLFELLLHPTIVGLSKLTLGELLLVYRSFGEVCYDVDLKVIAMDTLNHQPSNRVRSVEATHLVSSFSFMQNTAQSTRRPKRSWRHPLEML
jgi:hypothetical protein